MDISILARRLTLFWNRLTSAPRGEVRVVLAAALIVCLALAVTTPAFAGPGGQFAKALFKTWPGKIALAVLCFILLPLGIFVVVREAYEVRKTRRDLAELAKSYDYFEWAHIKKRVEEAAAGIGHAWGSGDLERVADYMTRDYRRSQQELLDRWRTEGKKNVYEFFAINKIKPLYVSAGGGWLREEVSVLISATVIDYLLDVETGKVLKGKKRKDRDYETIWNLVRENGAWRLRSIEQGDESLNVAMRTNRVESVLRTPARQPSQLPATRIAEDFLPAEDGAASDGQQDRAAAQAMD